MGHIRLGILPHTKKWQDVVDLLGSGVSVHEVAEAAAKASELPAVALVNQVARAVVGVLIPRWGDVQAAPGGQLQARGAEMQLDAVLMTVADPEHVVLLTVQPGERQLLEGVHHETQLETDDDAVLAGDPEARAQH